MTNKEINGLIKNFANTKKQFIAQHIEWFNSPERIKACEKCGRQENLTIDHIIPLDILADFGSDCDRDFDGENLRILCAPCNRLKSNHLDFSTPKTKKLLLKYLEKMF